MIERFRGLSVLAAIVLPAFACGSPGEAPPAGEPAHPTQVIDVAEEGPLPGLAEPDDGPAEGADAPQGGAPTSFAAPVTGKVVVSVDFEDQPAGPYDAEMLKADWGPRATIEQGIKEGRAKIVDIGGNKKLEITYPARGYNVAAAVQFKAPVPARAEYFLEYKVKFNPGFAFVDGGKMPGLVGGSAPTGCKTDKTGMSARYMWQKRGGIKLYLYHAGKPSSIPCGDALTWNRVSPLTDYDVAETGVWHTLRQHVRLNTTYAPANGLVEVWFDGKLVLQRANVLFRQNAAATWMIDKLYFSTFFGGNSSAYAPAQTVSAVYDDFKIWHP